MKLIVGVHTIQVDCVLLFEKNDFLRTLKYKLEKSLSFVTVDNKNGRVGIIIKHIL